MACTAFLDACVLYSAPLRDILLRLALRDLCRLKWSPSVHVEWMRRLAVNRPDIPGERLERLRELIDSHARDALVENYSGLIPGIELPDPADRHVLAAAIVGRADVIVTFNLSDFPTAALAPYGIEAQHPDRFLTHLLVRAPDVGLAAMQDLRRGLRNPPVTANDHLALLHRHGLPSFAAALERLESGR
jgi:predicted nucleic acid-binding protein